MFTKTLINNNINNVVASRATTA